MDDNCALIESLKNVCGPELCLRIWDRAHQIVGGNNDSATSVGAANLKEVIDVYRQLLREILIPCHSFKEPTPLDPESAESQE